MFHIRALNGYSNSQNKTSKCTYIKCVYLQIHVCNRFCICAFVGLIVLIETLNTLILCKIISVIVWANSALQSIAQTDCALLTL
jgi:hypothetical protein